MAAEEWADSPAEEVPTLRVSKAFDGGGRFMIRRLVSGDILLPGCSVELIGWHGTPLSESSLYQAILDACRSDKQLRLEWGSRCCKAIFRDDLEWSDLLDANALRVFVSGRNLGEKTYSRFAEWVKQYGYILPEWKLIK